LRRSRRSPIAERRLDPDRLTALEATPSNVRPAFATLWNLDLAFADVVATTSEPALGAIRMAWWRERLEELDSGKAAAAEPRLRAIQRQLVRRGISGLELSKLEDAWLPLLEPFPWEERAAEGLRMRGTLLFGIGARLLGGNAAEAQAAGALWSLVDGASHCSDADSRAYLCQAARMWLQEVPTREPAALRPLTVLAALAAHDLRPGGRLGRVGVALAHRLRGTIPHG
jgi:phytoene synthase